MPSNLTTLNNGVDANSTAQKFFTNVMQPNFSIPPELNNTILSYFERVTGNRQSARILASTVIYTSLAQNQDPMMVFDKIRNMDKPEIVIYLNMFFNISRVGTSYLGVQNRPKVSKYLLRTLLV